MTFITRLKKFIQHFDCSILYASLASGVMAWTIDVLFEILFSSQGNEIIHRVINMIMFFTFGIILAYVISKNKNNIIMMEEDEKFLRTVIDSIPYPFYVINIEDYTVEVANIASGHSKMCCDGTLKCYAATHKRTSKCDKRLGHECPITKVMKSGGPITIEHVHYDKNGEIRNVEIHAAPIRNKDGKIVRILEYNYDITERKNAEEWLRHSIKKSVGLASRIVEFRDVYTSGHQKRVAEISREIARRMGMSETETEHIHMAAMLHDIGKIAVPTEILSKPGKLQPVEKKLLSHHPLLGAEMLDDLGFHKTFITIIKQHHERLDGSGYPMGLADEEIVTGARIVAVADVVEAMVSHRPYRPAVGIELAIKEIKENSGKLYDRDVVDTCVKLHKEGILIEIINTQIVEDRLQNINYELQQKESEIKKRVEEKVTRYKIEEDKKKNKGETEHN